MTDYETKRAAWLGAEPPREGVISTEFCFTSNGEQCPACLGHNYRGDSPDWLAWRRAAPPPPKAPHRLPRDIEQCKAITHSTGERCRNFKDKTNTDDLCGNHANSKDRAATGYYYEEAERLEIYGEQFTP